MKRLHHFIHHSAIGHFSILNPLVLAVLPALIIIFLEPVDFKPFVVNSVQKSAAYLNWFDDLQGDSHKEYFFHGVNADSTLNIFLHNDKRKVVDQLNFAHYPAKTLGKIRPVSADFTKDGVKEIIVFTQHIDSVFLSAIDYKNDTFLVKERFITKIGGYNHKLDYSINHIGFADATNDSIPEYYFSISGAFALKPRQIFRYDFAGDSLLSSMNTGASYLVGTLVESVDSFCLLAASSAHGNTRSDYPFPYHDTCCWLFGFDKNLELLFTPIPMGKYPSSINNFITYKDKCYAVLSSNNQYGEFNRILILNAKGEIIKQQFYSYPLYSQIVKLDAFNNHTFYTSRLDNGQLLKYDMKKDTLLNVKNKAIKYNTLYFQEDIDSDGTFEMLFYDKESWEAKLFSGNLNQYTALKMDEWAMSFVSANYFPETGEFQLILTTQINSYIFSLSKNPRTKMKLPFWILIYLLSTLFISGIVYFQNQRNLRRQFLEQQIANLQLQNLRNQLDPHFTFNALNSVGNAIYKQDREAAYDLFQRFTRMIHSSLMDSDQVFRSLELELQFTRDYLEFQKTRFKTRFNYSFILPDSIQWNEIEVPKMLVQGFAENAVKHAFYGIDYLGSLVIEVKAVNQRINVIITDNGIGIRKSKQLKKTSGTQKGQKLFMEQLRQINKLYKKNMTIRIVEISSPSSSGTQVILVL